MRKHFIWIILFFMTSPIFAQDGYTKLREKYFDNEINRMEYAVNLISLYQNLRAGEYHPETDGMAIKCMLPVRAEMRNHLSSHQKATLLDHRTRPLTQVSYKTETGNFIIHYDTTGTHAVELIFSLGMSVPDWIYETGLSYEWVRKLLVDSLGYRIPPIDSAEAPECDVYIQELSGSGIYGETVSDFIEDTTQSSWIRTDNDFSENIYFSNGLDGMQVTAAHQYFHAVQLAYNFRFSDIWFFELAATWFEDVGYDEVNDYVNYIDSYYRTTDRPLFLSNGYSAAIFGKFLEENYDISIMNSIWNFIVDSSAVTSIDKALKLDVEKSDGIKAAFGKFALWTWYTGTKSVEGLFFEESSLYPEFELNTEEDTTFSDSVIISPLIGLNQLAFKLYRFKPVRNSAIKATFTADNKPFVWGSKMTAEPPLIISLPTGVSVNVMNVSSSSGLIVAVVNGSYEISDVGQERYSIEISVQEPISNDGRYSSSLPAKAELAQNYPNPFNPVTTIEYILPKNSNVSLIVYDILGQEVTRLYKGNQNAGLHKVYWNASIVSSGIYFYRLQAGDFVQTRKMLLLK